MGKERAWRAAVQERALFILMREAAAARGGLQPLSGGWYPLEDAVLLLQGGWEMGTSAGEADDGLGHRPQSCSAHSAGLFLCHVPEARFFLQMGKKGKSKGKGQGKVHRAFRARNVDNKGAIKRRKGDLKSVWMDNNIKATVISQRPGGKVVADTNQRVCMLHHKCDCVVNTDMGKMQWTTNMDATRTERDLMRYAIEKRKLKTKKQKGAWKNKKKARFAK